MKLLEDFLVPDRRRNGLYKSERPKIIHPNPDLQKPFLLPTSASANGYIFCLDHPAGSMYMLTNQHFKKTVPVFPELKIFTGIAIGLP